MEGRLTNGQFAPGVSGNLGGRMRRLDREAIVAIIRKADYEPILEMINISRQPNTSNYLRFECAKEIASYLYPKQKAVQLSADPDTMIRISWDDTASVQQAAESVVQEAIVREVIEDDE